MPSQSDARAKQIFGECLDLEPDWREAHLDRACAGDDALRRRVRALLAAAEAPDAFLSDATLGGSRANPPLQERPGARLGPYRLLEQIGEGGFGAVFMAEQESPVRRRVALKIIKLGMDTRAVVARFEQERQALAMMDHPNIAKVLDAGATDTGRPYFVMELVKGQPITEYCDRHGLTIRQRLELVEQVCRAVQHAHTKGVIHRDLKPSNVLVSTQDGRAMARIIDFGIAKATQHRLTEKTVFTEFRQLIGTPEYMSPEQAEGSIDLDTRTDVYSLGVLLYELLTGATPFDPARLRSAAYGELQRIIREVEPPIPSTRVSRQTQEMQGVAAARRTEPGKLGTLIRGELDWIVMKALEKDRGRRYGSASDLAADLHRFLSGAVVHAAPPSSAYRARKFLRRHRTLALAGSVVALTLVAGTAASTLMALRERQARRAADAAESRATARARDLEAITAFQSAQLKEIDPQLMGVRLRDDLLREAASLPGNAPGAEAHGLGAPAADTLAQLLDGVNFTNIALKRIEGSIIERALAAVDQQFNDQPEVRASLLQTLADTLRHLGLPERAMDPQARALELRREALGPAHELTLASRAGLATVHQALSNAEEFRRQSRELLDDARRTLGPDHHVTLQATVMWAQVLREDGKFEEAEATARQAVELSTRLHGPESPDTAGALSDLSIVVGRRGKTDESIELSRRAWEIRRRAQGERHIDTLVAQNNLAFQLEEVGRMGEALELYRACHAGASAAMGDDHPLTLTMLSNLAISLGAQGRLAEAEAAHRRAYEARQRVLGAGHEDTLMSAGGLAAALTRAGRFEEAEALQRLKYTGRLRLYGPDHPATINAMSDLASSLMNLGRPADAEPLARGAYAGSLAAQGPDDPDTLINLHNYAAALFALGRHAQAEPLCVEGVTRLTARVGPAHRRTLDARHALGKVRLALGRAAEAEADLRAAADGRRQALGELDPRSLESRFHLARALTALGRFADAEREALALAERLRDDPPAGVRGTPVERLSREVMAELYATWNAAEPDPQRHAKAEAWTPR